jgi:hypothetical protein
MKLQDILKDVLDDEIGEPQSVEVIVTELKEAEEKISPGDVYVDKRTRETFLVLTPLTTKFGTKWEGVEFDFNPRYGEPFISAGLSTTVAEPKAFEGYKKSKLTGKQKKAIQKMLKDPENLDQLDRAGSSVRDIERYIR